MVSSSQDHLEILQLAKLPSPLQTLFIRKKPPAKHGIVSVKKYHITTGSNPRPRVDQVDALPTVPW